MVIHETDSASLIYFLTGAGIAFVTLTYAALAWFN